MVSLGMPLATWEVHVSGSRLCEPRGCSSTAHLLLAEPFRVVSLSLLHSLEPSAWRHGHTSSLAVLINSAKVTVFCRQLLCVCLCPCPCLYVCPSSGLSDGEFLENGRRPKGKTEQPTRVKMSLSGRLGAAGLGRPEVRVRRSGCKPEGSESWCPERC